jgi:lipopolysaccharide transport system permease protein
MVAAGSRIAMVCRDRRYAGRGSQMSEATITKEAELAGQAERYRLPATPTRVYTPDSPVRTPVAFLKMLLRDARQARILAWRLFVRDISAQYRQTAIGYVWAVLPAVFTALVWVALQAVGLLSVNTGDIPYIAYVLAGMMFWQLFVDALNAPLKMLGQNRSMLNRVNFPTEAIFASGVGQVLFNFAIRLVVLGVVLAAVGAPVKWSAPGILLPAFGLLLVGTALGLVLAPAGVLYQDIQQGLNMIIAPLMFLTPVIYAAGTGGVLGEITRLNPLTPMFEVMRGFLFGGIGPYLVELGIVSGVMLAVVCAAWVVYRLSLPMLIERIEA